MNYFSNVRLGFFCSSAVCGWAGSMKWLIVGRALQGIAGGGCVQLVSLYSGRSLRGCCGYGDGMLTAGRLRLLLAIYLD